MSAYRSHRMPVYRPVPDDAPSPGELAEMAADDAFLARRRKEAEDAARARGEYVADPVTAMIASAMAITLGQHGIGPLGVTPVRELIYRLDGITVGDLARVEEVLGDTYDVAARDSHIWVRALESHPLANPPF